MSTLAASQSIAAPGDSGTPQGGTVIFEEDFQNTTGTAGVPITGTGAYRGNPTWGSMTYTTDTAWAPNQNRCNGWVVGRDLTAPGDAGCTKYTDPYPAGWAYVQGLAYAIGKAQGQSDSLAATNHALAAFTNGTTQAAGTMLKTDKLIFAPANRYYAVSAYFAAMNCQATGGPPKNNLYLLLDDIRYPISPANQDLNPCDPNRALPGFNPVSVTVSDGSKTQQADVYVAQFFSDAYFLISGTGTTLGLELVNNNPSVGSNDGAFDMVRIVDVTPQLHVEFGQVTITAGNPVRLKFTITNTDDLQAKNGWSFTDTLPDGMTVAETPNWSSDCGSPSVSAEGGESVITVAGNLDRGVAACTVEVDVTAAAGDYTHGPENITEWVGLDLRGTADLTATPRAIYGTIFNDTLAGGTLTYEDVWTDWLPAANVTVALYDSVGAKLATTATDIDGNYSFDIAGLIPGTYYVRPVRAALWFMGSGAYVNAVQTWGAGSAMTEYGLTNTATIECQGGDVTSSDGGPCAGAKSPLGPDPDTTDPDSWLSYATLSIATDRAGVRADFAFTTAGSYGDAWWADLYWDDWMPVHVNGISPVVWLGDSLGAYQIPAHAYYNPHNPSDDGVFLETYMGLVPFGSTGPEMALVPGRTYDLHAKISGDAANAHVAGWVTDPASDSEWNAHWIPAPAWTPTLSDNWASGPFTAPEPPLSGGCCHAFRADVSTVPISLPTNEAGEYWSASRHATPGEIEDYVIRVSDAVIRPAVKTNNGESVDVNYYSLSGTATPEWTILGSLSAAVITDTTFQANIYQIYQPDGWQIVSITLKDSQTGEVVSKPDWMVDPWHNGSNWGSIAYDAAPGSDVIMEIIYGSLPDPAQSVLSVSPDTVYLDAASVATATVKDDQGRALSDVVVTFATTNPDLAFSAPTCTTDSAGVCSVDVTSTAAGVYTDEISATVNLDGEDQPLTGSPASVTFVAPTFAYAESTFTVTPVAGAPATWVTADGTSAYTATLTAVDNRGLPMKNLAASNIHFAASDPAVTVSPVTNNNDGTYSVTLTSTLADPDFTATVAYLAEPVGVAQPIPFKAGPAVVGPLACADGRSGTSLALDRSSATAGGSVLATVLVTDTFCNPVAGVAVDFSATGSASLSPAGAVTGPDGIATARISDDVAETVSVGAAIPAGGVWNAPLTVKFLPGPFDPATSSVTIDPVADLGDQATWVTADGVGAYTLTLHAADSLGNPLASLTLTDIAVTGSSTALTIGSVVNNGDGTYSARITSTVADPLTNAGVAYKGTPVGGPQAIPFKAGPPVAGPVTCAVPGQSGSNLAVSPTPLPTGDTANATVLVTDQFCNPVAGVPVTITIDAGTDGVLLVTGGTTDATGRAYATLTDDTAEDVVVRAKIDDLPVAGSPRTVTFTPGGFSYERSYLLVTPAVSLGDDSTWVLAGSPTGYQVELIAMDSLGNQIIDINPGDVEFFASSPDVTLAVGAGMSEAPHVIATSLRAGGGYTITGFYNGNQVGGAYPIPFKAGAPVTSATCADGRPGSNLTIQLPTENALLLVGDPVQATALVTDAFCNPVAGAAVTFTVSGSGTVTDGATTGSTLTVVTDASGRASVTVTDAEQEIIDVRALIGSGDIAGSPAELEYRTCWFSWDTSTFEVTLEGGGAVDPADPGTWATADGVNAYIGVLTARDVRGDPLTYLHVLPSHFTPTSAAVTVTDVVNNGDGTYTVRFTSTVADATAEVFVGHDGDPAPGAGYPIPFKAGAPVAGPIGCADGRVGTNLAVAPPAVKVGGSATATVLVTDQFCNPVAGVDVSFGVTGSAGLASSTVATGPDGFATTTVTDRVAELVDVSAAIPGDEGPLGKVGESGTPLVPVWNSPQPVTFLAGVFSAARSTVEVTPIPNLADTGSWVVADGVAAYTVTLTARDEFGNVLVGLDPSRMSFTASSAAVEVSGVGVGGDGSYFVSLTSTVADAALVAHVAVDGTAVGADLPVPFRSGPAVAGPVTCTDDRVGTSLAVSPTKLAQGQPAQVTALVTDAFCNPVAGAYVSFGVTGSAGLSSSTDVTGPDGRVTVELTDDVAEAVEVTATIPAGELDGSPVEVLYTDETAPAAPVITAPVDGSSLSTGTPVINGTGSEPGNTVTVSDGDKVICTAEVQVNKSWTCTPGTPLADGSYTLTATETDKAGNESEPSDGVAVSIGATIPLPAAPPAPVITAPAAGDKLDTATPVIGGTGSRAGNTVTVTADDKVVCVTAVLDDLSWTCDPTPLGDGDHTFTATQTDAAGQESDPSEPVTVTIDTTIPVPPVPSAPVITGPAAGTTVEGDKLVISGTGEPGATVTVRNGTQVVCTAPVTAAGTWTCVPDTRPADGELTLTATQKSAAGESAESAPVKITIGTAAPDVPPPADPAKPSLAASNGSLFTGTTDPATTVTIRDAAGKPVAGCTDVRPDDTGKFSCRPDERVPAGETVTARAADADGRQSEPVSLVTRGLAMDVEYETRDAGEYETVIGRNFNPGETVHLVVTSKPFDVGYQVADESGTVTFRFKVSADFEPGEHTAILTGAESGSISQPFTVLVRAPAGPAPEVDTGGWVRPASGDGLVMLLGLLLALAGVAGVARMRVGTR